MLMRMLSSILTKDREVPSLLCFVPGVAKGRSWWNGATRPGEWLHQEVRVYFVCAVSMEWDEASGFTLMFTKEWVMDALPYLKVGIIALKIAAAAGRLAGFPIPDFVGSIGQLLEEQLGVLGTLTDGLDEAAAAGLKAVEDVASAATDGGAGADPSDVSAARGPLHKSCAAVKLLLDAKHPNWHLRSGLEPVTCVRDGLCEWVLPKYADEFRQRGEEMLGAQSKEQAADPGAVQRAVQEVRKAYKARLAAAELAERGAREREQQLLARLEAGTGSSSRLGNTTADSLTTVQQQQQKTQAEEQEGQPSGCGLLFGIGDRRPRSIRVAPTPQASSRK
ncbi:hypothetical protein FOA52_012101 [Chlamydomonas sp. UWO 241]|nr:hypothetical protein FOA52_012101 [Chlamydomonas sp. UWO 241]